jgi:hypothetical protein
MSLTHKQAVDDMFTLFKNVWDATGHEVFWESVNEDRETDDTSWATVTIRHALAARSPTLGGVGKRDFSRLGIITIQIFSQVGKGLSEAYALAKITADAYEGIASPNGVWFRDVTVREIGRVGQAFQMNVLATFEYDETK